MKDKFKSVILVMLILFSGSVFFTVKYGTEFKILFISIALIIAIFNFRNIKNNLKSLITIIIFLMINSIANIKNNLSLVSMLILICLITAVAIIQNVLTKKEFKEKYIQIMYYLCIISLICYFFNEFKLVENFPFSQYEVIGTITYRYSFYHTWGWVTDFGRNAGVFWEPGVFQAFINIALMMIFFSRDIEIKGIKNRYSIVFFITLITTKSTTGYIIFVIMLAFYIFAENYGNIKGIFLIPITLIICIIIVGTSKVINDKLSMNNISANIRLNDTIVTSAMIKEKPVLGNGYGNKNETINFKNNGITNNSNGFLVFIYRFGVLITLIILIMYLKGIKNLFEINTIMSIPLVLIFIIFFSTEALMLYPLFLTFLFKWKEN